MPKTIPAEVVSAARAADRKYGVPASVTIAQWALESAWGTHMPAGSNNPFGMKATKGQLAVVSRTREVKNGKDEYIQAPFRKFANLTEAFDAHSKLLAEGKPYAKIKQYMQEPLVYVDKLTGLYATDPMYGTLLKSLINTNGLLKYDVPAPSSAPVVVVAAASTAVAVAVKTPVEIWHSPWFIFGAGGSVGMLVMLALLFALYYWNKHNEPLVVPADPLEAAEELKMAIRTSAQPLIDQITALAAKAAAHDDLQQKLDAANATIAQMTQDDTDTDAAIKAAADAGIIPA